MDGRTEREIQKLLTKNRQVFTKPFNIAVYDTEGVLDYIGPLLVNLGAVELSQALQEGAELIMSLYNNGIDVRDIIKQARRDGYLVEISVFMNGRIRITDWVSAGTLPTRLMFNLKGLEVSLSTTALGRYNIAPVSGFYRPAQLITFIGKAVDELLEEEADPTLEGYKDIHYIANAVLDGIRTGNLFKGII